MRQRKTVSVPPSHMTTTPHSTPLLSTEGGTPEGTIIGILCGVLGLFVIVLVALLIYLYIIRNQRLSQDHLVTDDMELPVHDDVPNTDTSHVPELKQNGTYENFGIDNFGFSDNNNVGSQPREHNSREETFGITQPPEKDYSHLERNESHVSQESHHDKLKHSDC